MNNYERIINEINDKKRSLGLMINSGVTEDLQDTINKLQRQVEQLERYSDLVKFSEELNSLYDARRNASTDEEKAELERRIDEYANSEENVKFFSLKYRNDILNIDPEFYKHLRDTYNVELVTPEKFKRDLGIEETTVEVQPTEVDAPQVTYDEVNEVENNPQESVDPKTELLNSYSKDQIDAIVSNYSYLNDDQVALSINNVDLTAGDLRAKQAELNPVEEEVVEAQQPVELFQGDIGAGMPTPEAQFEQATGMEFDPEKYEIVYDGASNESEDDSYPPFTVVEREQPEVVEEQQPIEVVEEKQLPSVIEPSINEDDAFDRAFIQNGDAPVEDKLEGGLKDATGDFTYVEQETKPIPVISSEKQEWDPRLTTEQILDALSRDIYEPVGPEYEQFLGELGLGKPQTNVAPVETTPVVEQTSEAEEVKEFNPPAVVPVPEQEETPAEEVEEDIPEEDYEEIPQEPVREVPKKQGRSLEAILYSVTLDEDKEVMDLTKGKRKAITNSRVNVTKSFVNRVKHGNLIYNILGVTSSIIPMFVQSVSRWINKAYTLLHPQSVKNYDKIIENLYNLSDEDLEVLRTELTANRSIELRNYVSILPLVHERVANYIEEKYNVPLREEIADLQIEIMDRYKQVDQLYEIMLAADDEQEKAEIMEKIEKLSSGACDKIRRLKELKLELAHNLEGGPGIHVSRESVKAVDNNAGDWGKAFSKKKSTKESEEFSKLDAQFGDELVAALNENDNINALLSFGDKELHEYTHTEIKKTWMGYRSVGDANWKLMPEHVNYNNDPLLGYIFTTISTIGLAKGILTEIHNQGVRREIEAANQQNIGVNDQIRQANDQNSVANQLNKEQIDLVHSAGAKLESRSGSYVDGINTMTKDSVVSTRTAGEYNAGDATNWSFNSTYRDLDHASHESVHASYDQANQAFADIQAGVQNGSLDAAGALQEAQRVLETVNQSKFATYNEFLETMKTYVPAHPQHDYQPLQEYMDDIVNNQSAIDNMVDGMVESIQVGQSLQEAVMQVYSPVAAMVTTLPDNIQSYILPLVTQAAITGYLNRLHGKFVVSHPTRDYEGEVQEQYEDILEERSQLLQQLHPEDYEDYEDDYEDEFEYEDDYEEEHDEPQQEVEEDYDEEYEEEPEEDYSEDYEEEQEVSPRRKSIFERIRDKFTEEIPEDEYEPLWDEEEDIPEEKVEEDYTNEEAPEEYDEEVVEEPTEDEQPEEAPQEEPEVDEAPLEETVEEDTIPEEYYDGDIDFDPFEGEPLEDEMDESNTVHRR